MNNKVWPALRGRNVFKIALLTLLAAVAIPAAAQQILPKSFAPGPSNWLSAAQPTDPEAIFESARVVHNVTVDGQKGMRVHATFRVKYGLHTPCMLIAYYFFENGQALKTSDPKFRTKTGTVYSSVNFTPAYDPAVYKDLELFMPYNGLNMHRGEQYDLKFYLSLYDKSGDRFFGKSGWYPFKVTMP